jgi:hypothetical protein
MVSPARATASRWPRRDAGEDVVLLDEVGNVLGDVHRQRVNDCRSSVKWAPSPFQFA